MTKPKVYSFLLIFKFRKILKPMKLKLFGKLLARHINKSFCKSLRVLGKTL